MLEHVRAEHRFLVFGNERRVPRAWLKDYGHLIERIEFFFVDGHEQLEKLWP